MSTITTLRPSRCGFFDAAARDADRIGRLGEHRHVDASPEHAQLLDRRRALEVGGDQQRLAPLALSRRASLPAAVVFPEPCRPASITTVGGFELMVSLPRLAAERRDELLVDDLDDLLGGAQALRDLGAVGAFLDPVDERLDDRGR